MKKKPEPFKVARINNCWSVIAVPIVAYHLPTIVTEAASKVEAKKLASALNNTFQKWAHESAGAQ